MKSKNLKWIGPVFLMATIFTFSGQANPNVPLPSFIGFDKLGHLLVFGLLATSILRSLPDFLKPFHAFLIAWVATSLFGIADELHQSTTPGRTLDLYDWTADTLGAFIASFVYLYWPRYRKWLEWRVISLLKSKQP